MFVSAEDHLTASQKNQFLVHTFDEKSVRKPDASNNSFHFHEIAFED